MGSTADEDRRLYASLCRRIAEAASEADVRAVVRAALDRLQAPGLRDSILERVAVWRDRHDVLVGAVGGRRRLVWRRVESAFHGRLFGGIISNRGGLYALPEEFFEAALPVATREVRRAARDFGPLRINGVLHARFWNPARETSATIPVSSGTFVVYPGEDVSSRLREKLVNAVLQVLDSFEEGESGLAFEEILYLKVNVNKLIVLSGAGDPLTNTTWVPLPIWLQRTKALVNVRNADNKCFLWSVLGLVRTLVSRRGYKFYARNLDCLACFPAPTTPAIDSRFPPPSSSYRRRDGGDDGGAVTASGACCSPIPGTP